MTPVPFALSLHGLFSSIGADAGFAAVIGLAILTLLYFAHAQETRALREEAAVLAQRLQEAEASLAEARGQAVVAEALPRATSAAAVVAGPGDLQLAPAAPAGVGAPALAAATRFVPAVAAGAFPARRLTAPSVAPAPAPAPFSVPSPAPAASGAPARPATVQAPAPEPVLAQAPTAARAVPASIAEDSRPAPATVAGAANGAASPPRQPAPARFPEPPVLAPPPRRGAPARSTFVSPPAVRRSSPGGRRFIMLVGALILVGAAAAVVIATSGTGASGGGSHSRASNAPVPTGSAFVPGHVTVAVLNGTATNQLAHHISAQLAGLGYQKGAIATASNQTEPSTVVAYLPGSGNRVDAIHVAKALHLGSGAVTPINQAAKGVACPPPNPCTANVVVTVGADLAGT